MLLSIERMRGINASLSVTSLFCFYSNLKSNSITIHKNLIVAVFVAELTFLLGSNRTADQVGLNIGPTYVYSRVI